MFRLAPDICVDPVIPRGNMSRGSGIFSWVFYLKFIFEAYIRYSDRWQITAAVSSATLALIGMRHQVRLNWYLDCWYFRDMWTYLLYGVRVAFSATNYII